MDLPPASLRLDSPNLGGEKRRSLTDEGVSFIAGNRINVVLSYRFEKKLAQAFSSYRSIFPQDWGAGGLLILLQGHGGPTLPRRGRICRAVLSIIVVGRSISITLPRLVSVISRTALGV